MLRVECGKNIENIVKKTLHALQYYDIHDNIHKGINFKNFIIFFFQIFSENLSWKVKLINEVYCSCFYL